MLGLSVVIAAIAFTLSIYYLSSKEDEIRQIYADKEGDLIEIVVATRELQPGDIISAQNMALATVAKKHVSKSAVTPGLYAQFEGHAIVHHMSGGEPLLTHSVSGVLTERFSDLLKDGERAITLQIDELNSNSHLLTIGDYIDVLMLTEQQGEDSDDESAAIETSVLTLVLGNVRVLAIGGNSLLTNNQNFLTYENLDQGDSYSEITVAAQIDDAAQMILARDAGDLVFMMRNRKDENGIKSDYFTDSGLASGLLTSNVYEYYGGGQSSGGNLKLQKRRISAVRSKAKGKYLKSKDVDAREYQVAN